MEIPIFTHGFTIYSVEYLEFQKIMQDSMDPMDQYLGPHMLRASDHVSQRLCGCRGGRANKCNCAEERRRVGEKLLILHDFTRWVP